MAVRKSPVPILLCLGQNKLDAVHRTYIKMMFVTDATSQYVKGYEGTKSSKYDIYNFGLQCVTVLIGVYNIVTGLPVMGVIYQPFHEKTEKYVVLCVNNSYIY